MYIRYFWQGRHQLYGHIRCVYTVLVNPRYFWQGKHQIYGHIRCIYGIFGREITKYTVIYGVFTIFLAGKSPNIRAYTVYIYGSGQPNMYMICMLLHATVHMFLWICMCLLFRSRNVWLALGPRCDSTLLIILTHKPCSATIKSLQYNYCRWWRSWCTHTHTYTHTHAGGRGAGACVQRGAARGLPRQVYMLCLSFLL